MNATNRRTGPGFGDRLRDLRRGSGLNQTQLGARIGVAQTTVAHYEGGQRFPDEGNLLKIADLFAVSLDYLLGRTHRSSGAPVTGVTRPPALPDLRDRYLAALVQGRQEPAIELILEAVDGGTGIRTLYLEVLQPALVEIGALWQSGRLDVAQEHFATATTELIMSRLHSQVTAEPAVGPAVVVLTAYGELHTVGARMVGDFLRMEGWRVFYLGPLVPTRSLLQALERCEADVLALSVTLPEYLEAASTLIRSVHTGPHRPVRVLVGGNAFRRDPDSWRTIGADGCAEDAAAAVEAAGRLVEPRG